MQSSDGQHEDDASPGSFEDPCSRQQPATTSTGGKKGGPRDAGRNRSPFAKHGQPKSNAAEEHARAEKAGSTDASDDGQQRQNVRDTHEGLHQREQTKYPPNMLEIPRFDLSQKSRRKDPSLTSPSESGSNSVIVPDGTNTRRQLRAKKLLPTIPKMVIRFGAAMDKKLRAKPGHVQKSPQEGYRLTHVEDIMPTRRGSNREALRRGVRQLAGARVGKNDAGIGLPAQAASFNGISCLRKHATQ